MLQLLTWGPMWPPWKTPRLNWKAFLIHSSDFWLHLGGVLRREVSTPEASSYSSSSFVLDGAYLGGARGPDFLEIVTPGLGASSSSNAWPLFAIRVKKEEGKVIGRFHIQPDTKQPSRLRCQLRCQAHFFFHGCGD